MWPPANLFDSDLPWQSSAFHVAARFREVAPGGSLLFNYVEIDPGGRILPHAAPREEWLLCLEGEGYFLLGEGQRACHAGACLHARAGMVRGAVNNGSAPLRLLLLFQDDPRGAWRALQALRALLPR